MKEKYKFTEGDRSLVAQHLRDVAKKILSGKIEDFSIERIPTYINVNGKYEQVGRVIYKIEYKL